MPDTLADNPVAFAELTLPVKGLDCAMCAESLAADLRKTPGVQSAAVNFGAGTAKIAYDASLTDRTLVIERITVHGYGVPLTEVAALKFRVRGMDCADCAQTLQRAVAALPGVEEAQVNFGAATMLVTPAATRPVAAADVAATAERAGYAATLEASAGLVPEVATAWWRDARLRWVLVAAACWVAGMGLSLAHASELAADLFFGSAILLAGWPFARAALQSLRARRLDMNVLMTVSAVGAALLGEWGEGAAVIVLFALGGALQERTLERTRGAIRSLMALSPATASRIDESGRETTVPVAELRVGDIVRVRPGERLPADGVVTEGITAIDQSPITGESIPVDKAPGDDVFAGTVNGSGAILLRVTRAASDSTLARIIALVEEAQGSKAPAQQLVDRFAAIYTPLVIVGAVLLAAAGSWITHDSATWVYRALALLVIACPCALIISTPVSIVSAIGAATNRGILIKGGAALEAAGHAQVVALDKTGTLTAGRPAVSAVVPLGGLPEADLLAMTAAVEALSEHPLARAVVAHVERAGVAVPAATGFQAMPGKGARATVSGAEIVVGSMRLAKEMDLAGEAGQPSQLLAEMQRLAASGATPLFVAGNAGAGWRAMGVIALADELRPHAAAAIQRLRDAGIARVVVLTGDTRASGEAVAAAAGADEVLAELLPEDKAAAIASLRERYGPVVMVGDGVNDAPALAAADVGVAMGAAGTDVALETADIALMGDDLNGLAEALLLSRATNRAIRQNVTFSFVIKVLALVLAAFGFVSLWIAVVADVGASLAVTANGLRLSRARRE
ncbi:MAG: heavy metal translocating P-type ATPase [Thermomicrobiales bacterium]